MGFFDRFKKRKFEEKTPLNLQVGDMVEYHSTWYFVTVRYVFTEDDWTWYEYRLEDEEGKELWLSAEDEGKIETAVYEAVKGADVTPGDKEVTLDDTTYRLDDSGTARVEMTTRQGTRSGLTCKYWDYVSSGAGCLSVEDWSGSVEVSVGREVGAHEYTLHAGTGNL